MTFAILNSHPNLNTLHPENVPHADMPSDAAEPVSAIGSGICKYLHPEISFHIKPNSGGNSIKITLAVFIPLTVGFAAEE